jgi:hypothetical protein
LASTTRGTNDLTTDNYPCSGHAAEQEALESAHYHKILSEFGDLIKAMGARQVISDFYEYYREAYDELYWAVSPEDEWDFINELDE